MEYQVLCAYWGYDDKQSCAGILLHIGFAIIKLQLWKCTSQAPGAYYGACRPQDI